MLCLKIEERIVVSLVCPCLVRRLKIVLRQMLLCSWSCEHDCFREQFYWRAYFVTCKKFIFSNHVLNINIWGFSGGSVVKNSPANAGDTGSILESGRSPGEGNGNPLQYCCLGNPMDRGAWQDAVP